MLKVQEQAAPEHGGLYFSDYFGVSEDTLDAYGAFDVSLVTDLPLFVDPFLLFHSPKDEYQGLHDGIIRYLRFLRAKSESGRVSPALVKAWYRFGEVKQNWLGFCRAGNSGRGLGREFAEALDANLVNVFRDFGRERITRGSHLEKLCLIRPGVGKDMVSDFTTNLIKDYLLSYTEAFAEEHLPAGLVGSVSVGRVFFDYDLERWMPRTYRLPVHDGDFVLLTPRDILTRDDTWISHSDMWLRFQDIPFAVDNDQLRAEINNYFYAKLPEKREPSKEERSRAIEDTLRRFPELIDFYIKWKEDTGDQAAAESDLKVRDSYELYVQQFGRLIESLQRQTPFYAVPGDTRSESLERIEYFKDVVENKGAFRHFYDRSGRPVKREEDIQILFRFVWFGTPSDVSREVNDGRGPADYKVSRGARDKTIVEFKLASNSHLRRNLEKQVEIYQAASDAETGIKVIFYFSESELGKVQGILNDLGLTGNPNVVLVDARSDNKPSASKA